MRWHRAAVLLVSACLSACALVTHATTSASEVTPIQKVVSLLQECLAKGKSEKHGEQVEFAKFQSWCEGTRAQMKEEISEAKAQIVQLKADIEKAKSDAEVLAGEIGDLQGDVAQLEVQMKNATAVRTGEKADYQATHKDYSESIDAIDRAIAVLQKRKGDVPQSLLQLKHSSLLPADARATISSFVEFEMGLGDAVNEEMGVPEANAYEFQSGGVIGMLQKLGDKFSAERYALQQAEMNANANYEVLMQSLTDDLKRNNDMIAEKTSAKAQKLEDAAKSKGELDTTKAGKADDEKTLAAAEKDCYARSEEFEKNQVTRAAEIKAIVKAIGILQSDAVAGNDAKHLRAKKDADLAAAALAQLRSTAAEDPSIRQRVAAFLQKRAGELGSRTLTVIADRAAEDPFKAVKKLIQDLIVKLMEEAISETDKKGYCDTELATNKQTRQNKAAEVSELTAAVEKATADSAQLGTQIKELSEAIAATREEQAEATRLREEEKAKNAQQVADARAGQAAVERATAVLKDFYGSASDTSLLQGSSTAGQLATELSAESAPYTGMQGEAGGILGMLQVILDDFARLEVEGTSAEGEAQSAYEKYMAKSGQDVAVKDTETKHKQNEKDRTDDKNQNLKKELELTQEELAGALEYFEKLKPDCVNLGLSYEERKRMREEEIESLKEALKILTGEDLS